MIGGAEIEWLVRVQEECRIGSKLERSAASDVAEGPPSEMVSDTNPLGGSASREAETCGTNSVVCESRARRIDAENRRDAGVTDRSGTIGLIKSTNSSGSRMDQRLTPP